MNIKLSAFAFATLISAASFAQVNNFSFQPSDQDLDDLDHYYAYEWGLNWNVPAGQQIVGAQLEIKNIWDWTTEDNDILYITLMDNAKTGVTKYYDNQGGGDYFANKGVRVGTWTDPIGGYARNVNLSFDLKQLGLLDELQQYAADGKFGFGFDADCHYYNDGVKLKIQTAPVPEPASLAALAIGGVGLIRRRRKSK